MVRKPCCSYAGMNRGLWTAEEDFRLTNHIQIHGVGNWRTLPMKAGQYFYFLLHYVIRLLLLMLYLIKMFLSMMKTILTLLFYRFAALWKGVQITLDELSSSMVISL